jgi:mannose-6-phosphate isomerase-like protein (cupin superfamily)
MEAVRPSKAEMEERYVARHADLVQWDVQSQPDVPQEVLDLLYARQLCMSVAPAGLQGPFANAAPVKDADFSLTWATCPPGQGPGLHTHAKTTETFTCIRGRFRVYWQDERGEGSESEVVLEELDTISVPPGVIRGFQNIGDVEGIVQVLITGGVSDMNDIAAVPEYRERIAAHGEEALAAIEATGLSFDAGA